MAWAVSHAQFKHLTCLFLKTTMKVSLDSSNRLFADSRLSLVLSRQWYELGCNCDGSVLFGQTSQIPFAWWIMTPMCQQTAASSPSSVSLQIHQTSALAARCTLKPRLSVCARRTQKKPKEHSNVLAGVSFSSCLSQREDWNRKTGGMEGAFSGECQIGRFWICNWLIIGQL